MADQKITELTALGAAPATSDIIAIVDDPGGTPQTKKITIANFRDYGDGMPKTNVRARAYPSSGQSNITNDSWTTVQCDTESYDTGSDFNTSTYTFTAPVTGWYFCKGSIAWSSLGDGTQFGMRLYKNGSSAVLQETRTTGADLWQVISGSTILNLSSSDTIVLQGYQNGGDNTPDISGSGERFTFIDIHLLST